MDEGIIALAVGALLAAGILASLLAGRLRLPGLVLVLVLGMVIGSDGLEWINFDDYEAAQSAAVIALALILYEGGLSSGWAEIRPVIGVSIALATIGTALTAGLTAVAAALLFSELSTLEALILGSTVAATDAAAVFAVLRGSTLRRQDRAHAGGRIRRQRPDRRPARPGQHRGHQPRGLRLRSTRSGWRSPSWRSRPRSGSRSAASA